MVFPFLPRAASVNAILFRPCMDAPSILLWGAIFLLLSRATHSFSVVHVNSSGYRLVVDSDLTSWSGIYVRAAEDRKTSSENIYQFI